MNEVQLTDEEMQINLEIIVKKDDKTGKFYFRPEDLTKLAKEKNLSLSQIKFLPSAALEFKEKLNNKLNK